MALGPCKLPLPAFPRFNAGGEYGAIGDPGPLIADIPEMIKTAAAATSPLALVGGMTRGGDVAAALILMRRHWDLARRKRVRVRVVRFGMMCACSGERERSPGRGNAH